MRRACCRRSAVSAMCCGRSREFGRRVILLLPLGSGGGRGGAGSAVTRPSDARCGLPLGVGAPSARGYALGFDAATVGSILGDQGVSAVHDLHVWSVAPASRRSARACSSMSRTTAMRSGASSSDCRATGIRARHSPSRPRQSKAAEHRAHPTVGRECPANCVRMSSRKEFHADYHRQDRVL